MNPLAVISLGDLDWPALVAIFAVCLAFSAFFSGTETGYMSVSRVRLRFTGADETAGGRRLLEQLKDIEDPILTCLVGTNLFNVMASAVATWVLTERFGEDGQWLAVVIVSTAVIIVGEILPKVLYREHPETLTLASGPALRVAMVFFAPVRMLLRSYTRLWSRVTGAAGEEAAEGFDRLSLTALLLSNSVPQRGDQRFAEAVDRFMQVAGLNLGPLMRPLDQLVSVGPEDSVGQCLQTAASSGFSRLPLTREDGRQLQGYVLVRDLLFLRRDQHDGPVPRRLWRSFLLVDVRMSPFDLFEEMRHNGKQMAVVVEPGGSPLGLVTLEDLIESVIGSVHDEFDRAGDHGGAGVRDQGVSA